MQDWATASGEKMASAASNLDGRQAAPAAADQQAAIDELEKIWDAVIPFQALLARDLADQTAIAGTLAPPEAPADAKSPGDKPSGKDDTQRDETQPASKDASAPSGPASLGSHGEDLAPLAEMQQRTLRRTQLLKLKAEAELERMDKQTPDVVQKGAAPPPAKKGDPQDPGAAKEKPVDPKLIKAGYQKAIELSPRTVEQMERTVKSLKQKDAQAAYPPAVEARKILEEIQKAQPKQEQQDQKKNEDQQKQDQKDHKQKEGRTEEGPAKQGRAEERRTEERPGKARTSRRKTGSRNSNSRRSLAIGSRRPCAGSASGSRRSASATA